MLEKVAALEVSVRVNDGIQVSLVPRAILLDLLDFALVCPLENSVACNVIPSLSNIFSHPTEDFLIVDSSGLKEPNEIVGREMTVRAAMSLADSGVRIIQNLLARVRRVATTSPIDITTDITVRVSDVVLVPRVELVICEALEGLAPEENTFLERQTDSFEKECVLETSVVFQVIVLAQGHVQAAHAQWEVLRKGVDAASGDRLTVNETLTLGIHRFCAAKVLGKVIENGGQAIVFV